MVQVCEGNTSKREMLDRSIEQYREVFLRARGEFDRVISVSIFNIYIHVFKYFRV